MEYQDRLLNLKANVVYVAFNDPQAGKFGKLINITDKKQWKPNGMVAGLLLYLLARDEGDDIKFDTLKDLVKKKYSLSESDAILKLNAFLTKIDEGNQLLEIKPAGGISGTSDPDPLKFFDTPEPWNKDPDITLSTKRAHCKPGHYYGTGYVAVTIRR
jgi:hypothetical protein